MPVSRRVGIAHLTSKFLSQTHVTIETITGEVAEHG